MASVSTDKSGNRTLQFIHPADGKRRTLRLGKLPIKAAEAFKLRVEFLVAALAMGAAPDAETARWVAALPATMHAKLAAVGLVQAREAVAAVTLGAFLRQYLAGRIGVDITKEFSKINLQTAAAKLLAYFGEDRSLASVTPGDAEDYRRHLRTTLAENTVRRLCGRARQFFRYAVRKRLLAENPFAEMKGISVQANRSRDHFVTREDTAAIIDACPDAEWRLIVALARYGGLRCPSEILALRWQDVDFAKNRLTIRSSKTEHHEGKGSRTIPIYDELLPLLQEAFELTPEGEDSVFVIRRYRCENANLRTQLLRIMKRAGVEQWPKLFANMRASRATELARSQPAHVAAYLMGHSKTVAEEHYWQITDADLQRAAKSAALALQIPVQQADAGNCTHTNESPQVVGASDSIQPSATCDDFLQTYSIPPRGVEPLLPD